jgi:hypothetical protein
MKDAKARLKSVDDLLASRGWAVVREIMEKELVDAAMAIATSPSMTLDEINFRRGSIWAARQLLEMPEKLRQVLAADISLSRGKDEE